MSDRTRHTGAMRDPGPVRVLRGTFAASTATAVALGGHLLGGGAAPGVLGLLLPLWLSISISSILVGARLSLPRLSLAVVTSQVAFHVLFVLGTPVSSGGPGPFSPAAHHDHAAMLLGATPGSLATGASDGAADAPGLLTSLLATPMMLGHLLATAATVALLHRGELLLRRALALGIATLSRIGVATRLPRHTPLPRSAPHRLVPAPPRLAITAQALVGPRAGRAPPLPAAA